MKFEENLQFLRKRAGMTQEQLAEALDVTRQSVSKWESGAGFPEIEKLLRLSELFQIDIDTLLKGNAVQSMAEDIHGYDAHKELFGKMVSGGVSLIIGGVGLMAVLEGCGVSERLSFALLMVCIVVAVSGFIIAGLRSEQFEKAHPYIQAFYSAHELEDFQRKYPAYIVCGIAACFAAILWWTLVDDVSHEDMLNGVGFFFVAGGVGLLIRGGLLEEKYDIARYNREHTPEYLAVEERIERCCGVIMLIATAVFLVVLFSFLATGNGYDKACNVWIGLSAAAIFSVGGILCGIVSLYMHRKTEKQGKDT